MPKTVPTKPYDWTYTTVYTGHDISPTGSSTEFVAARPNDESHAIPIAELTRPDPILFYAEVPLFEDELHDNGASQLTVRVVSFNQSFTRSLIEETIRELCQIVSSFYLDLRFAWIMFSSELTILVYIIHFVQTRH